MITDNLTRLKADFIATHSMDYFTEREVMQLIDMAYCLGVDSAQVRNSKPVVRFLHGFDPIPYPSIAAAANANLIDESCIRKALKSGRKSAGYLWKYA